MAAATDSIPAPSRTLPAYRDARGRFAKRPESATPERVVAVASPAPDNRTADELLAEISTIIDGQTAPTGALPLRVVSAHHRAPTLSRAGGAVALPPWVPRSHSPALRNVSRHGGTYAR